MKRNFIQIAAAGALFAGALVTGSITACADGDGARGIEVKKPIVPTHVFAPTGFDSNDEVEFVIQGYYPNTCYHMAGLSVNADEATKIITVTNSADVAIKGICADMVVFYQRTVEVGILSAGAYKIQFADEGSKNREAGTLNVAEATGPNVDQYLYAPVQAAAVRFDKATGSTLTLSGQYTNSCAQYKETKVIQNVPDVIEILPIIEVANRGDCKQEHLPFHVDVPLKSTAHGETLIHIRALNGQAVNVVHYFD